MEYLVICLTSLLISIVTLFSGFGLGTVLMPVFAIFFPLPVAIASTAVIHLANNIFKAMIVGRLAKKSVVMRFGIPAALTAALGAYSLGMVSNLPSIINYRILDHEFNISYIKVLIGLIIIASALFELIPKFRKLSFPSKYILFGGALSGFFGGISGNQGILRSAFLIKAGLNKEQFIGTSVICSVIVDVVRLIVYGRVIYSEKFAQAISNEMQGILIAASLTAFLGSYIGSKLIDKVTFTAIQIFVGVMLLVLGIAIAVGIA